MNLSAQPLYAAAEAQLRAQIAGGRWKPGAPLPPEHLLAAEFGISQGTLRRALAALERQRVIEKRQGVGTYVTEATSERALFHFFRAVLPDGSRPSPTTRIEEFVTRRADQAEATALGLPPTGQVHALRRLRLVEGRAVIAEAIAVPAAVMPRFSLPVGVELREELYVLYQRSHGVTVTRVEERLAAEPAPAEVAGALDCGPGTPLLWIERIAVDMLGRAVELRRSWMATDRLRYAITLD